MRSYSHRLLLSACHFDRPWMRRYDLKKKLSVNSTVEEHLRSSKATATRSPLLRLLERASLSASRHSSLSIKMTEPIRCANAQDARAQIPKDAAAVILLRPDTDPNNPEVYLVKRSTKLAFLGGFQAFPGGQREMNDAEARVENCADRETAAMISCAARELFEEVGVLLARGSQTLTIGQRASLLDDLESKRLTWPDLLKLYGLHLDADDFTFAGRWVTPPFAPRRFDTWFFLVTCPAKQQPNVTEDSELESGEWIRARDAYAKWERSEVIAVPPVLHALKTLAGGLTDDLVERFLSVPEAHRVPTRRIEFHPNYICFPVRTPTKPPATHTNCYLIYNSSEVLVIDPGSPYEDEQKALAGCVDDLIAEGKTVREIILTHVHPDHVAGVNALE